MATLVSMHRVTSITSEVKNYRKSEGASRDFTSFEIVGTDEDGNPLSVTFYLNDGVKPEIKDVSE